MCEKLSHSLKLKWDLNSGHLASKPLATTLHSPRSSFQKEGDGQEVVTPCGLATD